MGTTEGEGLKYQSCDLCGCEFVSSIPAVILDTLSLVKRIRGFTELATCCSLKEENTSELATAQFVRANEFGGGVLAKDFHFVI